MRSTARKRKSSSSDAGVLSEERIVAAALEEIDSGGLANFSLRNLARVLNVYPTAVTWHVNSRDELLGRVAGYALRDVAPPAANKKWQTWLRDFSGRYRRAIQEHPNVAPLLGAQLLSNAGVRADLLEPLLTMLESAGFAGEALVDAYNVVLGGLVGFITVELAAMPAEDPDEWAQRHRKRVSTMDVMEYPTLARYLPKLANKAFILRWSNGTKVPLNSSFDMFVDVI